MNAATLAASGLVRSSPARRAAWCAFAAGLAVGVWLAAVLACVAFEVDGLPCTALGLALATPPALAAWALRRDREHRAALLVATAALLAMPGTARWPGGVTLTGFGFTVVGACPLPAADVTVTAGGAVRLRAKSHRVSRAEVAALAHGASVVVVATGWQRVVRVDEGAREAGVRVETAATPDAVRRYEALRRAGVRVALLLHSTC